MTLFSILIVSAAVLTTQKIQVNERGNKIDISNFQIKKLPVGMYFMSINNNKVVTEKRFLISE